VKFEESLQKLERIAQELEDGDMPLAKAIKKYQEAMNISRQCLDLLNKAQKKIQICLKDKDNKIKLREFKVKDNAGED
jgi:exodeoxyribonuclease VII small subunit